MWPNLLRRFRISSQIWRGSPESQVSLLFWSKQTGPLTRWTGPVRPNRTEIRIYHKPLTLETQIWAQTTTMGREKGPMVEFIFFFEICQMTRWTSGTWSSEMSASGQLWNVEKLCVQVICDQGNVNKCEMWTSELWTRKTCEQLIDWLNSLIFPSSIH